MGRVFSNAHCPWCDQVHSFEVDSAYGSPLHVVCKWCSNRFLITREGSITRHTAPTIKQEPIPPIPLSDAEEKERTARAFADLVTGIRRKLDELPEDAVKEALAHCFENTLDGLKKKARSK